MTRETLSPKPPFWTMARRDAAAGYVFIAPQLIGIITFVLVPLGLVFWYSLHEWNVLADTFSFVGGENYQALVDDPKIGSVLRATALFSALAPRTRIPPHHGSTNTRLLVHLPLVLPGPAGFRVGNETRAWRMGEAWVFDDTIEHEAWNDADETRVILIFDVWNPLLTDAERELVSAMMAARDQWYAQTAES